MRQRVLVRRVASSRRRVGCVRRSSCDGRRDRRRRAATATRRCPCVRRARRLSWRRVTEIPEHLLKRVADRRAALGLGASGESPAAAERRRPRRHRRPRRGDAGGRRRTAVRPAPAAARRRRRPRRRRRSPTRRTWSPRQAPQADPVLGDGGARPDADLGVHVRPLRVTEQPEVATGPLGVGAEVYGSCASCHGGAGEGGVGYPFANGEVLKTFPHIEDQLRFVVLRHRAVQRRPASRSTATPTARAARTSPARSARCRRGAMPAGGDLTDAEILAVVCHERYDLGGADPTVDYGSRVREVVRRGLRRSSPTSRPAATSARLEQRFPDIIPIGEAPVAGSPRRPVMPVTPIRDRVRASTCSSSGPDPPGRPWPRLARRQRPQRRRRRPRATPGGKPCGELLTPRALVAARRSGIAPDRLAGFHPHPRPVHDTVGELGGALAGHEDQPDHGLVARRGNGSTRSLVEHAVAAGATVLERPRGDGTDRRTRLRARRPPGPRRRHHDRGAGGLHGRRRRRQQPFRPRPGHVPPAAPGPPRSPIRDLLHRRCTTRPRSSSWSTSRIAPAHRSPGYGWMFPRGDGTANVGVLMMSTSPSFQVVNPAHLLDRFVADNGARWRLRRRPGAPAGRRADPDGRVGASRRRPDLSRRRRRGRHAPTRSRARASSTRSRPACSPAACSTRRCGPLRQRRCSATRS